MRTVTGSRKAPHRIAAVLVTATALLLSAATAAHAGSASGGSNYYDGKNPATTKDSSGVYCNVNASQIATRPITDRSTGQQVATLQIFYSWSCQSNWIRVTGNPYGGNTTKNIFSSLGGWNSESDSGYGSSYSMMVYAPGTTQINGEVTLWSPGINEYNWKARGSFAL
ncbi:MULTISPECIES: DUF2690 domain-containing protein [unclassified Micromonospora]|uniref:DUF2690 domain-containing protein n=1 Tax=unclassified Micromonospora TaxID=2617518 RepID=UPI00098D5B86|nr:MULTISPECIES: DUF2690 domain-containing protein [unclassified Micromonospora]MDI5941065.1 DUF2690 domain-containing protein [Micromonospora sp. DH15]